MASSYLARSGGAVYAVYPARRAVELIFQMRANAVEPKRMRLVHSRVDTPAEFVLLESVKGGGEELEVLPPVYIYNSIGCYTEEMSSIFSEISHPL